MAVGDSDGNFRNIADVVGDLREKFGGLSEVARSKALTDLFFKAGGNIQARRFWDIAVAGGGDLNGMMELMTHSSGALNEAYATMAATGATKTEIFKNKVQLLKIDLGKLFEPIKQAALGKISEWIDKFNALDESTKKLIVKIVSIVAAIGTVGGTGLLLIGTFLKIGAAILSINPWLLLIAAAAFLIYKNWDKIRPYFEKYWAIIQVKVKEFVTWLKITWEKLWPVLLEHIKAFAAWVINTWQDLWPKIHDAAVTVFHAILTAWNYLWQNVPIWINTAWGIIQTVWNAMQTGWNFLWNVVVTGINAIKTAAAWFWNEFGPSIMQVWNSLVQNIPPLVQSIWETIQHLWDVIVTIFNAAWPIVVTVVQLFWDTLQRIFHVALNILTTFWENWGGHLWAFIKGIWDGITDVVSGAIQAVSGIIRLVLDIINGKWGKVWGDIKDIFGGIWDIILGVLKVAMAVLVGAFETAFDIVKTVIQVFWDTLKNLLGFIGDVFVAGFKIAWDILKGAVLSVWAVIEPPLQAFWTMLHKIWDIAGKVGEVVGGIFKAGGSLLGKIPGLATGGNYGNGPFVAGENGPELIFPNRGGGYVMTASRSKDVLNSNSGQGVTIASGAVQISMGSGYDMNMVESVVNESFEKLVRTLQVRGNR